MNYLTLKRFAIVVCMTSVSLLSGYSQTLNVVQEKDKFGYADESGKIVIKPNYKVAYPFENGKAKVQKGDKWGYIDTAGKPVVKIEYDNIEDFKNGIALVKKGKNYGYIREDGSIYISPDFNYIGSINEDGYVWVAKGKTLDAALKGLYKEDKLIIPVKYQSLGFYFPTDSIDYTSGAPINFVDAFPANHEIKSNLSKLTTSKHPYIWAMSFYKTAIFDEDGKQLIKPTAGNLGMPKDGYTLNKVYARKGKNISTKSNFISADGKNSKLLKKDVEQPINEETPLYLCEPFENGLALCATGKASYLINTSGNIVANNFESLKRVSGQGYITKVNGKSGILDLSGKENVAPLYSDIQVASIPDRVYGALNENGYWGYISLNGEEIIPFKYSGAGPFVGGKAYVQDGDYFGVIDTKGNYVVRNQWAGIIPPEDPACDYIWVLGPTSQKWTPHKISSDKQAFALEVDDASKFDSAGRSYIVMDGHIGAVSTDGTFILPVMFTSPEVAVLAMRYIDENGKPKMEQIDAYRFNIYNHPNLKNYRLYQTIESEMWDY